MASGSLVVWVGIAVVLLLEVAVAQQLKGCGGSCKSNDECQGQLACMSGKCGDDPDVGTHICSGGGNPSPSPSCQPSGTKTVPKGQSCNQINNSECCKAGVPYKQYTCSPQITGSTAARLTLNGFDANEDGGGPSQCDGRYHNNTELIVALSTGWFNKVKCFNKIIISANGRSVAAKVVDQCDSVNGCDEEHDYQPPCANNIVDGSAGVWQALGLNEQDGDYQVTWKLA